MHIMRFSVGHELCAVCIYASATHKVGGVTAASWLCPLGQSREKRTAVRPLSQKGERLCYSCCAHPERIKFLQLLESLSSLLACALPTLGSTNSVHSGIQQDSWRHKRGDQRYTSFPHFVYVYFLLLQFYFLFFFFLSRLCLLLKGKAHASEIFLEYSQQ